MNLSKNLSHPVFKIISEIADNQNVFVIGGFVRDLLLNRPCKDIDIVIEGSGIELAEKVSPQFNNIPVNVFKNFGTAMIKLNDGFEIEFVGARKESYNKESRKPTIENGSIDDDQKRRDFTINALAIRLNKNGFGELEDPFGGLKDLQSKTLKTPLNPDITYSDDPLRMMRAIRFATQLNFNIEKKSLDAISRNKDRITIISQERISDELNKIILSEQPSIGFKFLFYTGLLEIIFPEMFDLYGVETIDGKSHKDNFFHTLQVLDNICYNTDNLWLRWAAILHDIAKPPTKKFHKKIGWTFHGHENLGAKMTPKIFNRLKLPMDHKMKYVKKLVNLHLRPIPLTKEIASDSAIRRLLFEAGDDIDDLLTLCRADITSKNELKVNKFLRNLDKLEERIKEVEERDRIRDFQPPISGELIMKTFNIEPSFEVGQIKNQIKEAIIEGEIRNEYHDAYNYMLKKGKDLGLKI